jgi:PIN domain nuclease of toxin-antitoxin system
LNLLLDTQIFIAISRNRLAVVSADIERLLISTTVQQFVSVATFWEIAIKVRLGKLDAGIAIGDLGVFSRGMNIVVLPVEEKHIMEDLAVFPRTNDPFDRLLLAVAQVERLALVTLDHALADHPLAFKP